MKTVTLPLKEYNILISENAYKVEMSLNKQLLESENKKLHLNLDWYRETLELRIHENKKTYRDKITELEISLKISLIALASILLINIVTIIILHL